MYNACDTSRIVRKEIDIVVYNQVQKELLWTLNRFQTQGRVYCKKIQ